MGVGVRGKMLLVLVGLFGVGLLGYCNLLLYLNLLVLLVLDDFLGWLMLFKLCRLMVDQCVFLLVEVNCWWFIVSWLVVDSEGSCFLCNVVWVVNFGLVQLSSSFFVSCLLVLSSVLYIEQQVKLLIWQLMVSDLCQIDYFGSFVCCNIYYC